MRIEDVLDLNELNVRKVLKYCRQRPEDPPEDSRRAFCYLDEDGKAVPQTTVYLSNTRYREPEAGLTVLRADRERMIKTTTEVYHVDR